MTKQAFETYINHEVRIQVVEKATNEINNKINMLIIMLLGSAILPVVLHAFKLT